MARNKFPINTYTCDECPYKHWRDNNEWNFSQQDHLPLTLECHKTGQRIVRGTIACDEIPQFKNELIKYKKEKGLL